MRLFVVAAPGLEGVVAAELRDLAGATLDALQEVPGGVEVAGDERLLYRLNLELRCATRVLLRVGEFRARDFAALQRGIAALPWSRYAATAGPVSIKATAHRSRLYHTGAVAERVLAVLAERGLVAERASLADPAAAAGLGVFLRAEDDLFTVSIDTSGELLHRRGWRSEGGEAPLRETLAAALLRLAGWNGQAPLRDPTCGSGTLLIEAALLACGRAPGVGRSFAFQRWPSYRPELFAHVVAAARAGERPPSASLVSGADLSAQTVELARRNVARAGLAELVRIDCQDVATSRLPTALPPGLVLCNPPYGRRLLDPALRRLYRDIGVYRRSAPGWHLGILCPQAALAHAADRHLIGYQLVNGGLRVALFLDRDLASRWGRDYPGSKEHSRDHHNRHGNGNWRPSDGS